MKDTYTQCRLQRGATQQVAWIPSKFAIQGNTVRIKNEFEVWRVIGVGAEQSADYVHEYERDFRHQREASDI